MCSTEFIFDDSVENDEISVSIDGLRCILDECLSSLDAGLGLSSEKDSARPAGFSLQIQYAFSGKNERIQSVLAIVAQDALRIRNLSDRCATSFMPVLCLGPRSCLRMTAIA